MPRCAEPGGVLQLAGRMAEAQVERLLARLLEPLDQIVVVEGVCVRTLHSATTSRFTNLVLIGSLCPASRIASRASSSGTPASSNMTLPGFTTATQPSGLPFPEPCRVSAGFFVYGLSGKMLIQTFPPRLILRVIATRAASIWRFVIQPRSSAFSPYSPNATCWPPFVFPRMRPRWTLRCLTRFGISIRRGPPAASRPLWEPARPSTHRSPLAREQAPARRPAAAEGYRQVPSAAGCSRRGPAVREGSAPAAAWRSRPEAPALPAPRLRLPSRAAALPGREGGSDAGGPGRHRRCGHGRGHAGGGCVAPDLPPGRRSVRSDSPRASP